MWSKATQQLIRAACDEDLGAAGDITSVLLPQSGAEVAGRVVVREPGVVCGLALGRLLCAAFSRRLKCSLTFAPSPDGSGSPFADGTQVQPGTCVATVHGPQSAVLTAERTLLNFLGRLSGVATLTHRYVTAARAVNPHVAILDTRKTLPGWRELDKYAVRMGGGRNHRFGLYDAVLIKDNHLAGIPTAQLKAKLTEILTDVPPRSTPSSAPLHGQLDSRHPTSPAPTFIEVEVDNLAQFDEVCQVARVDIILLDNFSLADMRQAVAHRDARGLGGRLALEASGGVTLARIAEIAATGVDRISVGALTHSAPALDIALDI